MDYRRIKEDIEREVNLRRISVAGEPTYSRTRLEVEQQIRGLLDALAIVERYAALAAAC